MPYEKIGKNEPVCIADEVPFDIPDTWEWVRLSKIVYNRGQMAPANDFCYIDIGSIDNKHQKLSDAENIIAIDKVPSRARKIVDIGDILYSTVRPYLHNMCIVDRPFSHQPIASTGFAALTCHTGFYNEFLFYYLMSPDFDAYANDTDNAKGVAYPAINDNKLYQALIPVPPEAEQKRIVEKIKEVLPYVDTYRTSYSESESLNNAFPNRLKKSILQEAVRGKLVPQDPADEPASILLERIRAEKEQLIKAGKIKRDKHESVIFRRDNSHYEKLDGIERCIDDELPFEIPESWEWCRIGTLFSLQAGKNISSAAIKEIEFAGSVKCYGGNGVRGYVSEANHHGDYPIIGRQGTLCGNINWATGDFYATEHAVCVDTFGGTDISWACLFLEALNLNQYATATAQPGLAVANINMVWIPLPPLNEQLRIVAKVDEAFPIIKAL
ncbi:MULTISPECIES: restriction endonuclease subunit S [unclassified Ruminococcus]|uniref:restriction endonuclease subunit S n=1 Tax=unclassified Ruminococcus TaxID=2608920 RepID=UPI00189C3F96|nr:MULTISPECIES: restriction endonuclease subunit S [unclassified Ruminococcus]MDB8788881.1 restriction endonuclease subunit S [Ruminococcus sp. 1001136sp1]